MLSLVDIKEIKLDVTWSYVKRRTAKMTSEFVFFSSNPSLNHVKIEKCLLLFATNTNIFTLLFKELKTAKVSFLPFAVCRKTTYTCNLKLSLSFSDILTQQHKKDDASLDSLCLQCECPDTMIMSGCSHRKHKCLCHNSVTTVCVFLNSWKKTDLFFMSILSMFTYRRRRLCRYVNIFYCFFTFWLLL